LLPLLVEHNMIKCRVTDDVESYEYVKKAWWECFQTMTRGDTLNIRTTPVHQPGTPLRWYISLGDLQYDKPVHQLKAIKKKSLHTWNIATHLKTMHCGMSSGHCLRRSYLTKHKVG
jgi:hypothetical protein